MIVDGKNLDQSSTLKKLNEVEKEDVKKKLPTVLDIVLRPELFENATYLSEGIDGQKRIISNEIKDEDDYYDDADHDDLLIATLDELYNEVEDIYDELYDNAEPVKPQNLVKDKPKATPSDEVEKSTSSKDAVIFPSSEVTTENSGLEYDDSEGRDFHEGSGIIDDNEDIQTKTDSTRIEFPRTLGVMKEVTGKDVDYDYPEMDMPVSSPLKDMSGSIELLPHNRLFPMPSPPSKIENEIEVNKDEINQVISPRNNLNVNSPDQNENKCFCPCKCTEEHSGPIIEDNIITTESSRTSAMTTG